MNKFKEVFYLLMYCSFWIGLTVLFSGKVFASDLHDWSYDTIDDVFDVSFHSSGSIVYSYPEMGYYIGAKVFFVVDVQESVCFAKGWSWFDDHCYLWWDDAKDFMNDHNINYGVVIDRTSESYKYGLNITNIPEVYRNKLLYVGLRIQDFYGFDASNSFIKNNKIYVRIPQSKGGQPLGYGYMVLGWDDLVSTGFNYTLYNKRTILISDVQGYENLFLDPTVEFETSDTFFASVSPVSDNEVAVCWDDDTGNDVLCAVYQTDGTIVTSEWTVHSNANSGGQDVTSVFGIDGDEFGVCFYENTADANCTIYYINGTVRTSPWEIGPSMGVGYRVVSRMLDSDSFVSCWDDGAYDTQCSIDNIDGTNEVTQWEVYNDGWTWSHMTLLDLSVFNSTHWVLCHHDDSAEDVSCIVYDVGGNVVTSQWDVDSVVTGLCDLTTVTLDSSSFVVCYHDNQAGVNDLVCVVYDINGTVITSAWDVEETLKSNDDNVMDSFRISDDKFGICWQDSNNADVKCATYRSNGTAIASEFNIDTSADWRYVTVASQFNGGTPDLCEDYFVVAYGDSDNDGRFMTYDINGNTWDGVCNSLPTIDEVVEPTDPSLYSSGTCYDFRANVSDVDGAEVSLVNFTFNGVAYTTSDYSNTTTTNWLYNYTLCDLGVQSNTAWTWCFNDTSGTDVCNSTGSGFTIGKSAVLLNLETNSTRFLNGTFVNITVISNVSTNVNLTVNSSFFVDQLDKSSPYENITSFYNSTDQVYNITCWFEDNGNYTFASNTTTVYLDVSAPSFDNVSYVDSVIYDGASQEYWYNITLTETFSEIDFSILEFNGVNYTMSNESNIYYKVLTGHEVGSYNFKFIFNDTVGNIDNTSSYGQVIRSIGGSPSGPGGGGGGGGGGGYDDDDDGLPEPPPLQSVSVATDSASGSGLGWFAKGELLFISLVLISIPVVRIFSKKKKGTYKVHDI